MSERRCIVCGTTEPPRECHACGMHKCQCCNATTCVEELKQELATVTSERNDLRAENARLREALRKKAIVVCGDTVYCHECGGVWFMPDDEQHEPGCLAAPKEGK